MNRSALQSLIAMLFIAGITSAAEPAKPDPAKKPEPKPAPPAPAKPAPPAPAKPAAPPKFDPARYGVLKPYDRNKDFQIDVYELKTMQSDFAAKPKGILWQFDYKKDGAIGEKDDLVKINTIMTGAKIAEEARQEQERKAKAAAREAKRKKK